jgi:hypothetical protein
VLDVLNPGNYVFNPFAVAGLLSGYLVLSLGVFILLERRRADFSMPFALSCIAAFLWQFGSSLMYLSEHPEVALFWNRFVYLGITFLPALIYHFSVIFKGSRRQRNLPAFAYLASTLFFVLSWTPGFFRGLYSYFWGFYPRSGAIHHIFVAYLTLSLVLSLFNVHRAGAVARTSKRKIQSHYVFTALLVACIG